LSSFVIEASKLVKYYNKKKEPALDNLNLAVKEGQIFTLLGRNGAGKTTFLRIATTQLLPTSGTVSVFGLDSIKDAKEIRRRIAITPQEAKPLWSLNAYDHVLLSLLMRGESIGSASVKAKRVLQTLELTEFAKVHSEELSGGLRQRILIAMTIACDVDLLFLDEPTIGLDPVGRRKVWNELIRLKQEERKSIVLSTHYMDEAEALSDELAIIDHGRVLASGTPAEVSSKHLGSRIRVDVASGFSEAELEAYGKVIKFGNLSRIFVDEPTAEKISKEALSRKASISISPVTLDDVFVEIVGARIEEEQEQETEDEGIPSKGGVGR
jgi:ABC-2 type transport system ATP-binding protein